VHSVFFEPAGADEFVATPATIGPWSIDAQHGGPPSALAAHLLERHEPAANQRLASVSVDILRPVPIGKLTARTRTVRPGRRVALVETVLEAAGQEVLHARGWRLARAAGAVPGSDGPAEQPPPIPAPQALSGWADAVMEGYMTAMEWRFVAGGGLDTVGPAQVWVRPTIPLLPELELSPMSRALLVADSGNGVSALLDPGQFLFVNVDLTVMLHRDPAGDWLLLDAATSIGPSGTGVAASTLWDTTGPCGRGTQTLIVAARGG
jgi:hypothetical protein